MRGPPSGSASCRLLERRQSGLIIGLLDDLGNELGVGDLVRGIDHEYRTGQERDRQALDQDAVMLAEAVVVRIGEVLHVLDAGLSAKPCLCEGQVKAYGVGGDLVSEGRELLGEPL